MDTPIKPPPGIEARMNDVCVRIERALQDTSLTHVESCGFETYYDDDELDIEVNYRKKS